MARGSRARRRSKKTLYRADKNRYSSSSKVLDLETTKTDKTGCIDNTIPRLEEEGKLELQTDRGANYFTPNHNIGSCANRGL